MSIKLILPALTRRQKDLDDCSDYALQDSGWYYTYVKHTIVYSIMFAATSCMCVGPCQLNISSLKHWLHIFYIKLHKCVTYHRTE